MTLGEKIVELRRQQRMSMRALAKNVGVTPMHISNIEKGFTTGSAELIARMAKALEADVDQLLSLADRVDPEAIEVIQKNPQTVPSFLRSAKDLTPEEWEKMQRYLERMKSQKSPEEGKKRGK